MSKTKSQHQVQNRELEAEKKELEEQVQELQAQNQTQVQELQAELEERNQELEEEHQQVQEQNQQLQAQNQTQVQQLQVQNQTLQAELARMQTHQQAYAGRVARVTPAVAQRFLHFQDDLDNLLQAQQHLRFHMDEIYPRIDGLDDLRPDFRRIVEKFYNDNTVDPNTFRVETVLAPAFGAYYSINDLTNLRNDMNAGFDALTNTMNVIIQRLDAIMPQPAA